MTEATKRLEKRRTEIEARIADIAVPKFGTRGYDELPGLRQELATIEQTLAQLDSAAALRRDTAQREAERSSQDDAAYWSRQFNTSLAIGNGAGFAVVTGTLLQAPHLDQALVFAWEPMCYFGPGVLFAGAVPWVLWANRQFPSAASVTRYIGILFTTLSAGLFALGIGSAIFRVSAAQQAAAVAAQAERRVEGAELAKRWKAAGLQNQPPPIPTH